MAAEDAEFDDDNDDQDDEDDVDDDEEGDMEDNERGRVSSARRRMEQREMSGTRHLVSRMLRCRPWPRVGQVPRCAGSDAEQRV